MGIVKSIKNIINKFSARYQLPEAVLNTEETILMHISDTPAIIYNFLFKVIDEVQPDLLIHTGDLVDNLKLENDESLINEYRVKLPKFISKLEKRREIDTYIVPGNHDSVEFLEAQVKNLSIIKEQNYINMKDIKLGVAHTIENLPADTSVNLYGHNMETGKLPGKMYLNGILNVHIILLPSLEVYRISYPPGTNQARSYRNLLLQRGIGL